MSTLKIKRVTPTLYQILEDVFFEVPGYFMQVYKGDLWIKSEIDRAKNIFNPEIMEV